MTVSSLSGITNLSVSPRDGGSLWPTGAGVFGTRAGFWALSQGELSGTPATDGIYLGDGAFGDAEDGWDTFDGGESSALGFVVLQLTKGAYGC